MKLKHPSESKIVEDLKREEEKTKHKRPKLTQPSTQPTLEQVIRKTQKYSKTSPQQKALDDCLLEMVVLDIQPASVVEDQGFRRFVNMLDPCYDIPSRRTLMRRLPTKYDKIKQRVMKVLTQVKHLSLTTDIWTSRATESFLTVTIHFIHSWKLKSLVLATIKFSTEHTGEHIADELQRITDHWEITHKVVGVVTDNASNMVAAIRITGWTHIHCFAHTLNLVVQEAIKNDPVLLLIKRKCKDIVTFFIKV